MDTRHGYDDKEFKAYCDSENMAVGSLYGIVAWKAWQASRKSVFIELPSSYENDRGVMSYYKDEIEQSLSDAGIKSK